MVQAPKDDESNVLRADNATDRSHIRMAKLRLLGCTPEIRASSSVIEQLLHMAHGTMISMQDHLVLTHTQT